MSPLPNLCCGVAEGIEPVYVGEHVTVVYPRRTFQMTSDRFKGTVMALSVYGIFALVKPSHPYLDAEPRWVNLRHLHVWRGEDGECWKNPTKKGRFRDV